jgi:hypothetical protein
MSGKRAKEQRAKKDKYELTEFDGEIHNEIAKYSDLDNAISDIIERLGKSILIGYGYDGYIWNICLSDIDKKFAYVNATILFSGQIHYYARGKGYSKNWEDNTTKPGQYCIVIEEGTNQRLGDFATLEEALSETKRLIKTAIKDDTKIGFKLKKGGSEVLSVSMFEDRI